MFEKSYEIRYGDYKDFDTVKPGVILDIIQDMAISDSARCGYNLDKLLSLGLAWMMQGVNVYFKKPVSTRFPMDVKTAVKALGGATSERGCYIEQNGETVAKSIAYWFIFDINKKRICKVPKEMPDAYTFCDFDGDEFFTYKKPEILEDAKFLYTVRVGNKDIDTNKHLNNQKGADILMDALPYDFSFNSISLLYKKSAYLGDELSVCIKQLENGYYVHALNTSDELCVAGVFENI